MFTAPYAAGQADSQHPPAPGRQATPLPQQYCNLGGVTLAYNTTLYKKPVSPPWRKEITFPQTSTFTATISIYEKMEAFLQCFQIPITVRTMVQNDTWLGLRGALERDQPAVGELMVCACQWYPVIKRRPAGTEPGGGQTWLQLFLFPLPLQPTSPRKAGFSPVPVSASPLYLHIPVTAALLQGALPADHPSFG